MSSEPKRLYSLRTEFLPHIPKKRHVLPEGVSLPTRVDLRSKAPPVFDQGNLGSCTANSLMGTYQYRDLSFSGSRLFLYYAERVLDGDVDQDAGSTISQGIQVLQSQGCCSESLWPYDVSKFEIEPPSTCYTDATSHKVIEATHVDPTTLKECLFNGNPVNVGIQVYQSFESGTVTTSGMVPMPAAGEPCIGGHAVCVYGFDDSLSVWIMRNSWGSKWGDCGYFYLPYDYLEGNLASDFWNIESVTVSATSS